MYYPYFYAREAELASVREIVDSADTGSKITAILEPTSIKPQRLSKTVASLAADKQRAYVILNPNLDGFEVPSNVQPWLVSIEGHSDFSAAVIPTFKIVKTTTIPELDAFLTRYSGEIGIVVQFPAIQASALQTKLARRIRNKQVLVFLHRTSNPQSYENSLGQNFTVRVGESLNVQRTNADYAGMEWFTSAHLTFGPEGKPGFSDFTVLRPEPTGGWTPPVVVAHITYRDKSDGSLWVHHFSSAKPPIKGASVGSKILEVARGIGSEKLRYPQKFIHTPGIASYEALLSDLRDTSLTKNKQHQITHHLVTVANLI